MNLDTARSYLTEGKPEQVILALKALGRHGKLTDLQSIVDFVKHDNVRVKRTAIESACTLIRENLILNFESVSAEVRRKLGSMMATLYPAVVDEIAKDLHGDDESRRVRSVQVLGLLKDNPRVREIMADLVKDRDERVRATAVKLLGSMVTVHTMEPVLALLRDKDKRVRANTVEALEALGNPRVVPVLLRFRKDSNNRTRGNVIKALYNLGHKDVEGDLMEMIRSKDNFMKASALWVVSQIRIPSREIEDSAGYFLLAGNEMVVSNARKALQALATARAGGYLRYLGASEGAANPAEAATKRQ